MIPHPRQKPDPSQNLAGYFRSVPLKTEKMGSEIYQYHLYRKILKNFNIIKKLEKFKKKFFNQFLKI